ncbi:hypothetical protein LR48_Vigan03g101800 [Vigna angularis]|uniref:Uncharacterized protein n=1 Tax=Phaseolus angularis TaxID=3914 RepID=A0A0L9U4D3_PHAAN|nr:hypothetical protein LR48_Vigan03g101800 [Vigna angularis]
MPLNGDCDTWISPQRWRLSVRHRLESKRPSLATFQAPLSLSFSKFHGATHSSTLPLLRCHLACVSVFHFLLQPRVRSLIPHHLLFFSHIRHAQPHSLFRESFSPSRRTTSRSSTRESPRRQPFFITNPSLLLRFLSSLTHCFCHFPLRSSLEEASKELATRTFVISLEAHPSSRLWRSAVEMPLSGRNAAQR